LDGRGEDHRDVEISGLQRVVGLWLGGAGRRCEKGCDGGRGENLCLSHIALLVRWAGGFNANASRLSCPAKAGASATRSEALLRGLAVAETDVELVDQLFGGIRNDRAWREDRLGAGLVQRVVVLRRHYAADNDHDVVAALLLQR